MARWRLSRLSGPGDSAVAAGEPSCAVFPADNPWNTDISAYPVHPRSDAFVNSVGRTERLHPDFGTVWNGAPIGIPYVIVPGSQPKVPVSFDYADESDPGPYPVPPDAPIEGGSNSGGDRHVLVIDNDNCALYEMFDAHPVNGGESWTAGSGAVFNLNSNALRPDFWTSGDAAGLPIFPGLVRYEEVVERGSSTTRCGSRSVRHSVPLFIPPLISPPTTPTRTYRLWDFAFA